MVLTSIKAALFTAIVTAFVLDAMSYLDENTSTKLLRVIAEQSAANSTIEMPPSSPPPSILTVSTLWFLSIMSSLAATTWAMLCLEWCAFLTDGVQAEDYEEMAEKRQRRYEAVKRWRMHLVVAAIPFFLHLSLFLFLAGLWLRLRDVNKQLGLIVGVPSLVIATSYVVVTFLPIFTNAPFSTSASELLQPVFNQIGQITELRRFIGPPRAFPWVASLLSAGNLPRTLVPSGYLSNFPRLKIRRLIPKRIREIVKLCTRTSRKLITLLPIVPRFGSYGNPFNELNKLKVRHPDPDKGVHLRALLWLMNTRAPLSGDEVKGILEEFRNQANIGKPLDRTIIRPLVLYLSSVLWGNRVSGDERPIFDHCVGVLAEEMDRAFGNRVLNQGVLLRNIAISEKLSPHFHLTSFSGDALSGYPTTNRGEDYWTRAIPALWFCPSAETIRSVVNQLDSDIQSMEAPRLQRIVRGLHAATLACFKLNKSTPDLIPDFSLWHWDSSSSDQGLDGALSRFLQSLFAAFYNTLMRRDNPTSTSSLVVECLKTLDGKPDQYTPELHNALCFFIAVLQRSDPKVFEEEPSVARALLDSAESYSGKGGPVHAKLLATRLRAIAYGPKPLISKESRALTRLGDLYAGLPGSTKTNEQCMERFLDANAGILEATLPVDGHFTVYAWQRSPDCQTTRNIWTDTLFTHDAPFNFVRQHPNHRLPCLYSLSIALSYTTEERRRELWRVANLLVTRDEQEGITVDRALDTNILVATVLRFALYDLPSDVEQEHFLRLLQNTAIQGTDWRTRWKSIYLIADLACLISRMNYYQHQGDERTEFLIDAASKSFEVELGRVPTDWKRKRKGLRLCRLETKVKSLVSARGEADEGIYEWVSREDVPYLSLYNPQRAPTEPISDIVYWFRCQATDWAATAFRWYVRFLGGGRL